MPTYQYACTECGHNFETVQSFKEDSLTECPQCTGLLRKLFSAVGIVFKGSGFYRTDSRSGSVSSESGSTASSGDSASNAAGSSNSSGDSNGSASSGSSNGSGSSSSGSSSSGASSSGSGGSSGSQATAAAAS